MLLRGVNDRADVLAELYERLVDLRVMPYYLHQLDPVAGAAHFEVPIPTGIALMAQLRARLPGYAVPRYVRETRGDEQGGVGVKTEWSPASWQTKPLAQGVDYSDREVLRRVLAALAKLPPLVTSWEVESLKTQLAEAQQGQRFLLQGGDCCERFADCRSDPIASKLKILLKMSLMLIFGWKQRVIRVGRFAGQYCQATLLRDGDPRRRHAAQLSGRSGASAPPLRPRPGRPTPGVLLGGYSGRP